MKKVYLIILDGFGLGKQDKGDAISAAQKPFLQGLFDQKSYAQLKTDGESVGLPSFQTGGSEVGHITLGAGRPVKHLLTKINDLIDSGAFFENETLVSLFEKAKKRGRIHLMGLISDGGIHSFLPHLFGLQQMARQYDIPDIFIHAITDGRDVGERTAREFLEQIEAQNIGKIVTVGGRYYGMDRDTNWDREREHYRVMTEADSHTANEGWETYIDHFYAQTDKSDYYLPPARLTTDGVLENDDILIFFNYRVDRGRQITQILCDPNFHEFERHVQLDPEHIAIFGDYSPLAQKPFCFGDESVRPTLGEIVSEHGEKQLRISETEKFNHVTYYFSGERKEEFPGETRVLVPSPKCASYAEKPEMSAYEQTDELLKLLQQDEYTLIVQNFANTDLVGHSGNFAAAKRATEVVDECLSRLVPAAHEQGYDIVIVADHGNSDEMLYPNGDVSAAHSKNLVPCFVLPADGRTIQLREKGTLADVSPTLLSLLGWKIPKAMIGTSLLK